ncbi:uncharacterized protein LOC135110859 [Scylla paramamosain]|uniref:uncharacterized protein LOC135110859 n=1 Tax=Scylla paramamosain TaxID=85552 RepID=UPI003083B6E7
MSGLVWWLRILLKRTMLLLHLSSLKLPAEIGKTATDERIKLKETGVSLQNKLSRRPIQCSKCLAKSWRSGREAVARGRRLGCCTRPIDHIFGVALALRCSQVAVAHHLPEKSFFNLTACQGRAFLISILILHD